MQVHPGDQLTGEMIEVVPGTDTPNAGASARPLTGEFKGGHGDPTELIPKFVKQVTPMQPVIGRARKAVMVVQARFTVNFAGLRLTFDVDDFTIDKSPRVKDARVKDQWLGYTAANVRCVRLTRLVLRELRHRYEDAAGD